MGPNAYFSSPGAAVRQGMASSDYRNGKESSLMEYRILGRTGLAVSPITIGTWQLAGPLFFGGKPDGHPDPGKDYVLRLIRELGERGINSIDTAEQYGNGESERRVGEAIQGRRDRWIVSTKFGYRVAPDGTRVDDSGPDTIMSSLEGSLRRLRTDYIDIYLFHCAPRLADLDTSRNVLEQAKAQGKIRYSGISTGNVELTPDTFETCHAGRSTVPNEPAR